MPLRIHQHTRPSVRKAGSVVLNTWEPNVFKQISEFGSSLDVLLLSASVPVSQAGAGVDSVASVSASLSVLDSGTAGSGANPVVDTGGVVGGFINTSASLLPPMTGPYHFNNFKVGAAGFPAVGGSYVDPIFGGTVRRLTAQGAGLLDCDIYAHCWANADGTMAFSHREPSFHIISVVTGAILWPGQPEGNRPSGGEGAGETYWDPIDPGVYWFKSGASFIRRTLATQTNQTVHTFPSTLDPQNGSINIMNNDGRYVVLAWGGTAKIYDIQTNTIYANSITPAGGGGWTGISPDGKYLITGAPMRSYFINHATQTLTTSGVTFWNLGGDHAAPISPSNGENYCVCFENNDDGGVWMVDVTIPVVGPDVGPNPTQRAATRAQHTRLVNTTFAGAGGGHFSAVRKGARMDWCFWNSENWNAPPSNFNSTPSAGTWVPWGDECIAINVITHEVRRFAHHRSRGVGETGEYSYQPRMSCSWDGSVAIFASNMNTANSGELYALINPNLT